MEKAKIRQRFLKQRKQLDSKRYYDFSTRVQRLLISSSCFDEAVTLALYSPVNHEVATDMIFSVATKMDKRVCYPKVAEGNIQFLEVRNQDDLVRGSFGVLEPGSGQTFEVSDIDLIVVPGVAFDLCGFRLGYGKGYYDRLLSGQPGVVSVGLGFEFQIHPGLPAEDHDQRLSFLATEARFIPCRKIVTGSL